MPRNCCLAARDASTNCYSIFSRVRRLRRRRLPAIIASPMIDRQRAPPAPLDRAGLRYPARARILPKGAVRPWRCESPKTCALGLRYVQLAMIVGPIHAELRCGACSGSRSARCRIQGGDKWPGAGGGHDGWCAKGDDDAVAIAKLEWRYGSCPPIGPSLGSRMRELRSQVFVDEARRRWTGSRRKRAPARSL